jgi:RimJ/RimL family protein N-acetyltransferase
VNIIDTGTLRLEPQTASHADEMFVVLSDPAIYEHENQPPASLEWLRERFTRLETRRSADGRQQWLNWVIRLPSGELIGYVQATVLAGHRALIAYELGSAFWGRGLARRAVEAMIGELAERYGVRTLFAVLKRSNDRSLRLLKRLGFTPAPDGSRTELGAGPDEWLMQRDLAAPGTLIAFDGVRVIELGPEAIPALQRFFDTNPEYFQTVNGQPPSPTEGRDEFDDLPPAGMTFRKKWLLGVVDDSESLVAMATILSDFIVEGAWHVGLFIVGTSLHGTGTAQRLYCQLENWMRSQGAQWLRLGVVEGNERAERFWRQVGYTEVRKRLGVAMGVRVNDLRVMVKPLRERTLADYLSRMVRDRPGEP